MLLFSMQSAGIDLRDARFVQIVDAAMAEASRKAGSWLACRLGCTQCCIGPFPISPLDARRLRRGLAALETADPDRAHRVQARTRDYVARVSTAFPGDPDTGILDATPEGEKRFESFADDEPCPALDPQTGGCDLYSSRPLTCRTFGPPMRAGSDLVVCELCFDGATDADVEGCAVDCDPDDLESALDNELVQLTGATGQTIVAFALAR